MIASLQEILQAPAQYENKSLEVRGFVYRGEEGNFFLSDTPNVRSCCLHKVTKLQMDGKFEEIPKQAVSVNGKLVMKGQPILMEAKLQASPSLTPLLWLPAVLILLYALKKLRMSDS